jgi:hypothetical protein
MFNCIFAKKTEDKEKQKKIEISVRSETKKSETCAFIIIILLNC